jgi:UDP-N-acetylglucosamine acyltransferase
VSGTEIHPTAIIDPGTEIGAGCFIGPYCVIGPHVQVGAGCWLQHHVSLHGPSRIGCRNRFYCFASIGQQTQDLKYQGEPTFLEIGDENSFREFVTVNRGTAPEARTSIGSRGNFLAYSHVAHDCTVGDGVIFSNNGTIAGHVEVGDHAVIGGLTAVHQFCRIGRHAITGGCSKIVQDVPPFMIADGNPAEVRGYNKVGMERHGFSEETVKQIKEAYRIVYRSRLNLQQAITEMRTNLQPSPEVEHLIEFVSNSPRGIIK